MRGTDRGARLGLRDPQAQEGVVEIQNRDGRAGRQGAQSAQERVEIGLQSLAGSGDAARPEHAVLQTGPHIVAADVDHHGSGSVAQPRELALGSRELRAGGILVAVGRVALRRAGAPACED